MIDAVLRDKVEQVKYELDKLLTADSVSIAQLQDKADTLHNLLSIDPARLTSTEYQAFLHENLQWLALTIEKIIAEKDQLGLELIQLAKRKKADKVYGENT